MNGPRRTGQAGAEPSAAALFGLLRDALADLLGTAAAATLLRRAAQRAASHNAELAELAIVRESLEYRYTLPHVWNERTEGTRRGLQDLVGELLPLLAALTGPIAVRHLGRVPELRERGIIPPQEEGP
jgi:hypothetical protein